MPPGPLLIPLQNFEFSNLCGTVYKGGNVLFTPDGNCLLSPVGNRITVFDLLEYVVCDL
jgi:periodic tryptophan protein 2